MNQPMKIEEHETLLPELLQETELFHAMRGDWCEEHENEWVWIIGSDFRFFKSAEDAIKAAYDAGCRGTPTFLDMVTKIERSGEFVNLDAGYSDKELGCHPFDLIC